MRRSPERASAQSAAPRDRLLGRASQLFYGEGINSVGIDRIVTEAGVTRATLYRHFPSKDLLVAAYLQEADRGIRARTEPLLGEDRPARDALLGVAEGIAADIRSPGFRGCAFLNAAAEFPDPDHPAHRAVTDHRSWFLGVVTGLFERASTLEPVPAAHHFVMLRDGAMAAGCLADPDTVATTLVRGVEHLVAAVVPAEPRD